MFFLTSSYDLRKTEWRQQEEAHSKRRKLSLAVIARHDSFRKRQEKYKSDWKEVKLELMKTHIQREKKKAVLFQKREKERLAALKVAFSTNRADFIE